MKRARIKACANLSLCRKVSKTSQNETVEATKDKNSEKSRETDPQLITNIKTESLANLKKSQTQNDDASESNFVSCKEKSKEACTIKNAPKFNIKLENEELHIFHEMTPVMIDKDSCQNESILPTQENNETIQNLLSNIAEAEVIINQPKQIRNEELHNENRVTIHDVIHTKLYARVGNKDVCLFCNGIGCNADHNVEQNKLNDTDESVFQRVKVGANGQLVVDDSDFSYENRMNKKDSAKETFIGTYKYKKRVLPDWNPADINKFYQALQVFGTDFNLMKSWFPNKSRNDLKMKFKKEEKRNGHGIDQILKKQKFNGNLVQKGIDITQVPETKNLNQKSTKEKTKKKTRKRCRFVINSIELSSTDEEESGDEVNSNTSDVQLIEGSVADSVLYANSQVCQNAESNQILSSSNGLNDMRYEEVNNILKEMKSKQEEMSNLKKRSDIHRVNNAV